jgi:hypothetical protein
MWEVFVKKDKVVIVVKKTTPRRNAGKKKSPLSNVGLFRWVKKSFLGMSRKESVDLLDQWILKKKVLTLFF